MTDRSVKIPEEVYLRLEASLGKLGFASVDEYVRYVLEVLIAAEAESGKGLSADEEDEMKRRLADLGYL